MFIISEKLLYNYKTLAGIFTFNKGIAIIICKVKNEDQSMLSAKLKKINRATYNQNKNVADYFTVSEIKVILLNSSSLPIKSGKFPKSFYW